MLKLYYLKCKHNKYLDQINEKKLITLFRQILKPYNFKIIAIEKYENSSKYLLYIIKKIDSFINFD